MFTHINLFLFSLSFPSLLVVHDGFQLYTTPTCLGLEGFAVVVEGIKN
jgi:hypothetical protein